MLDQYADPDAPAPQGEYFRRDINGRSWPDTERFEYAVDETVRWRWINASFLPHPTHLHGSHFRLVARGDGTSETVFPEDARPLIVTENMTPGSTFRMEWVLTRAGNWLFRCHCCYILHFSGAKQSKTRMSRIRKWVPWILDGREWTVFTFSILAASAACSAGPESAARPHAASAPVTTQGGCIGSGALSEQVEFAAVDEAGRRLRRPDDWSAQLGAFERSARRRTLASTSTDQLLEHLSEQALEWAPDERAYWAPLVERLSSAVAGANIDIPDIALIKSTGFDEFGAAYARRDAIVLPRGRVAISGDERADFFLLAHELFHLLSWNDRELRDELYALLGFERFSGFEFPPELERRRLSNPSGHTYDHALEVRTPMGTSWVVPVLRSRVPLAKLIALPPEGPAFFPNVEALLVAVDTNTGEVARRSRDEPVIYTFEETDWPQRMQRNTAYAIHPDEVIADNFASLMEWRTSGLPPTDTPGGVSVDDLELLRSIEQVLTEGCGPVGAGSAR